MPSKQITNLQSLTVAASGTVTLVSDSGVTKQMALSVINHNLITNKGTNTHANLDAELALTVAHRANISNPHSVTKTQIGLSAVTNDAQVKVSDIGTTVLAPDGNGSALTGIVVSDNITNITGDTTITAAQMTGRVRFYNSAQAAITLPAATVGLTATFEINHTGGIRFIRNGTNTFSLGAISGLTAIPGGANYDVVVGGLYELTCYVAGVWTTKRKGVQPYIYVKKNANQTGISVSTNTTVTWETEVVDNNANFASNTATLTVPGVYEFESVLVHIGSYTQQIINKLFKNGSYFASSTLEHIEETKTEDLALSTKDNNVASGDAYTINIYVQGGATLYKQNNYSGSEGGESFFMITRVTD